MSEIFTFCRLNKSSDSGLRLRTDLLDAHCSYALALTKEGKNEKAILEFHASLRIKPDLSVAHGSLAQTLAREGRMKEAIQELWRVRHRSAFFRRGGHCLWYRGPCRFPGPGLPGIADEPRRCSADRLNVRRPDPANARKVGGRDDRMISAG